MSPAWGHIVGVMTVIVMLVFVAIWIWAWRPRHRASFDEMARIPMLDGEKSTESTEERQ
jgi:cytochrome c oxidase cbb3-type subunit 4